MKKNSFRLFVSLLVCFLLTCKKDEEKARPYPRITTLEVTNITGNGAQFNAEIYATSNEAIIDHGFVWGNYKGISIDNSNRISLGSFEGKGRYSVQLDTAFDETKEFFVKSYVKTKTYIVIGLDVSFQFLGKGAPVITSFYPTSGVTWGDTITIRGKNFSWTIRNNKVYFNDTTVYPVIASDSILKVIVPPITRKTSISIAVEVLGNRAAIDEKLLIFLPELLDFAPRQSGINDTITLTFNFIIESYDLFVDFQNMNNSYVINSAPATILSKTKKQVKVLVPGKISSLKSIIKVSLRNVQLLSADFTLAPPEITSFSPNEGSYNTQITVKGKNFLNSYTVVKIGNSEVYCTVVSNTHLQINMPNMEKAGDYYVTVSVFGQQAQSNSTFLFKKPTIYSISPEELYYGDTVTIYGKYLPESLSEISYFTIENYVIPILFISANMIQFIVPGNIDRDDLISLILKNGLEYSVSYKLKKPLIYSISSKQCKTGDSIKITGKYFHNYPWYLNTNNLTLTYVSPEELKIKVIKCLNETIKLSIYWNNQYIDLGLFTFQSPYKKLDITYPNYFNAFHDFSVVIGDTPYVEAGYYNQRIYSFDKSNSRWNEEYINTNSNSYDGGAAGFTVNNKIYIVGGNISKTVQEFDPVTKQITTKNELPGESRSGAFGFAIGSRGFIGSGHKIDGNSAHDLWEYNVQNDSWIQKADFPGTHGEGAAVFVTEPKAYIVAQNEVWEYDPLNDKWSRKKDFPGRPRYHSTYFTLNNYGYMLNGCLYFGYGYYGDFTVYFDDVWQYDVTNDEWKQRSNYPGYASSLGVGFVINDKAYVGLGVHPYYPYFPNDLFEYDPSQDNFNGK